MTDRIQRMYEKHKNRGKLTICVEKAVMYRDSIEKHAGLPDILQRAYATADYFDNRTIYVDEDELLVGNVAAVPDGMEGMVWGPAWPDEDFDTILNEGLMYISPEDRKAWRECDEFWKSKDRSMNEWQGRFYDNERVWNFIQSGVLCPPWKDRRTGRGQGGAGYGWGLGIGYSLFLPDYKKIIGEGIGARIEEARKCLEEANYSTFEGIAKSDYQRACLIALEAMSRMYNRYGDLCEAEAAKKEEPRRSELLRMADSCHHIAWGGARDFRDAMQAFWFYWMIQANGTNPGGRFDQYMYPYYKKDLEEGKITKDEALELIECLRLKIMQYNQVNGGKMQRDKWAGMARWNNFVICGCDPETGKDATNDLSYLVLQSAYDIRTPHFTITVRVNKDTPDDLMLLAMKVVETGIGMPAFISEESYINTLLLNGDLELKRARDFAIAGCLDLNIPGGSRINAIGMFISPKVFEIFMRNGFHKDMGIQLGPKTGEWKDFATYEEFFEAFKKQLLYFQSLYSEEHNVLCYCSRYTQSDVLLSAFADDGIACGHDLNDRKMAYENASVLNNVGMINVANSLAAVKKLVYEDKVCDIETMRQALEADWEGYEDLRKACLEAPKYGNGDPFVDSILGDLYKTWCDGARKLTTIYGVQPRPTGISITAHVPGGKYTAATPDGRHAGDTLSDGTLSPAQGTDVNGPTAVFRSALAVKQDEFQAMLLNMKMHPTAVKTDEDKLKLAALVRTYLTGGGRQVQFNVVASETLIDAKKNPEAHKDLVVRVAGYSTYFTILTSGAQDEIIARTAHTL